MAKKPVGEMVISLDLESAAYTKAQQRILAESKETAKTLNGNLNRLGVTSDELYASMANRAELAFRKIGVSAKSSLAEVERSYAAMVASVNTTNQKMAANPLFETLGIRSTAAIKAQKDAVIASYEGIKTTGNHTAQDLVNIERAKNTKLKELNKEMVGDHEMSMASMTRAVLRFYAAYYVISAVVSVVGKAFMDGVATIDKMKLSAVTVAATITNLQGTSGNVVENYKKNLEYAQALVPVLMKIDAASLANLEQVMLINNAMAMHGVILDGSNKKQLESAIALTNAIAMYTVGQNKEQQATQETNALLNGEVTTRNRMALMIDQMIRRQGDYKDGLKGLNEEAKKHNDWLERINPYLVGIAAASGDISKTWEAVSSSLKTTWMILQTEIFADFYKGLITGGQEAIGWARENAAAIGQYFRIAMGAVGDAISAVWGVLKGFGPLLVDLAILIAPIAYGFGAVLAALKPIGEAIGNAIAQTYLLGKAIVSTALAASRLVVLDFEGAKLYWNEAKKGYSEVGALQKKNFNLLTTGVADSLVAYDKQYNAAKKAASAGYIPKVIPGKGDADDTAKKENNILRDKLAEATALNKEYYDSVIAQSDHWLRMQKLSGEGDLEATKEVIDQKKAALTDWYNAQAASINKYVDSESKRAAELEKLWREYSKSWIKLQYDNVEIAAQITKKETDDAITAMEKEIALGVKLTEEHSKAADEYEKIMDRENTYSTDKYQQEINKILEEEKEKYKKLEELGKAAQKTDAQIEADKLKVHQDTQAKITSMQMDAASEVFGAWSNALEGISQLYAQGSEEQKKYHDMAVAFALVEKGIIAAKAVVLGVEAVINAMAEGDGYTAVVRGLAVAAVVAAYLAQIGTAFNTSGSGSSASAALPTSTALGAGTGSQSIANSLKLMEDTYQMEDTKLTNIYNQLKDLNSNITGLVTSIVRTGGVNSAEGITLGSTGSAGTTSSLFDILKIEDSVPLWKYLDLLSGILATAQNFMNAIFGGGTRDFIQTQGIEIGSTIIKNILAGAEIAAQQYTIVGTEHEVGWFGKNWVSESTVYTQLDQNVTDMLTLVFSNLGTTLFELAKGLGTDTQAVLNYVFETTQLDLKDMTTEEMSTAINEWISNISDTAVDTLFGSILKGYQKLNEGLLETAVRLVMDKEIVLSALEMTGQAFTGTIPQIIKFSESLIEMAGGLDKFTESASTYFDKFYSDVEKQTRLQTQLSDVFAQLFPTTGYNGVWGNYSQPGIGLPDTREAFKALVEGLDLTTTSGQEAYITLLKLSESADAYYSYLEEVASKKLDMEIQIMELEGDAAGALAAKREIELAALDESLRPLQLRIYALQDEAQAITDVTTSITALKNRAQQIAQFIIDMGMSTQAPVQSAAAWDTEYARQKSLAMSSGATDQQVSDYLAFAKQYLSYEQSYGTTGSYQEIYDAIMKDVTSLGAATNTALDIAQKQLDVLIQIRDGAGSGISSPMWNPTYPIDDGVSPQIQGPNNPIWSKINIDPTTGKTKGKDNVIYLEVKVPVNVDGREIGNVVARQVSRNSDLRQSIQKAVN